MVQPGVSWAQEVRQWSHFVGNAAVHEQVDVGESQCGRGGGEAEGHRKPSHRRQQVSMCFVYTR